MEKFTVQKIPKNFKDKINYYAVILTQLIKLGTISPNIRKQTISIIRNLDKTDLFGQIKLVHKWVQNEKNIKYVFDPYGIEYIQTPDKILETRAGDCDDKAVLTCAMLSSIGFPTALLLVDSKGDGKLSHVIALVKIPEAYNKTKLKGWIPLETTTKKPIKQILKKTSLKIIIENPPVNINRIEEEEYLNSIYENY